jgi:hypothetical protein
MDSVIAQLERQARIRYLPLKPFREDGVLHLLGNDCSVTECGDSFGDAIDHFLTRDQELGRAIFGSGFFQMIKSCGEFPLRIESYATKINRREGAMALRELEYRVMGRSLRVQHLNFAHKRIPRIIPDHRLVRLMELPSSEWKKLWTRDTAIAIVPTGGPLNIAHDDGDDLLSSDSAAIIMAGARLMVRGSGFFVFHPLGLPGR